MGTIAEKLTYLGETKSEIKDAINLMGTNITNDTFRSYPDKIRDGLLDIMNNGIETTWNNWEKVTGTGTNVTLNNVVEAPMKIDAQGNTIQEGTPSPTNPIPIQSVGDNVNLVDFNSGGGNTTKSFTSDTLTLTSSGTSRFWQYNITDLYKANAGKTLKFIYDSIDITDQHGTTVVQMRVTDTSEEITTTTMLTHSLANTPYTIPEDVSNISSAYLRIWTNSYSSTSYNAELEIIKPKLQFGTENEAYSPYNMGVATIIKSNSDNTQSTTYPIYTQAPMRAKGEVRDDFIKQAVVWYERHKIGHIASYDGETITTAYMSTTGQLSTGAEVIYVLEEPILIECTGTQVSQLETIAQAKSYVNQTNIGSTDVIEPWLDCIALKNI